VIRDRLATLALRAAGWKFETSRPSVKKYVCIAAPHTSNWDGVLMLAIAQALKLPMAFMIKDDWVKGPMGPLMRRAGAVAINRSHSTNVVDQMIEEFARHEELALVIPPEGTRKRAEAWKSGFYHIDFQRKRAGLGEPIYLSGKVTEDMDKIRAFYDKLAPKGFVPEDFGPIRLREEMKG
jgi:1-acyl-sn-glycerol-3-phosphate acyltransferase